MFLLFISGFGLALIADFIALILSISKSFSGLKLAIVFCLLVMTCCLLITFANSLDPDQDQQSKMSVLI